MIHNAIKILLSLAFVAALGACGGDDAVDSPYEPPIVEEPLEDDPELGALDEDSDAIGTGEDEELLRRTTLYFPYDSSELVGDNKLIIEAHARYMEDNPDIRITLEGHTDERGTPEYNLALGERRSLSAAVYFQALGIAGDRMDSISYGETLPVSLDRNEESWRSNRRVQILYSY